MAYVVSNGSVVALTFEGRHESQQVMSVLHYRLSSGGTLPDGRAALIAFLAQVQADEKLFERWRAGRSVKLTTLRIRAQFIHPDRFAYVEQIPTIDVGAVAGDSYPVNTAIAVTRKTDNAGRDQVGTVHLPAIPITSITNGAVTAGGLALSNDFLIESLEKITTVTPAAEWFPILYHRASPAVNPSLTGGVVQPTARIMRRRTVGLGS